MKKNTAMTLLAVINTAVTLTVAAAIVFLFIPLRIFAMFAGVALLFGQVMPSVRICKRFKLRYGISAKRYVLYAAVPAVVLSVLGNIVLYTVERTYPLPLGWICTFTMAVYSAAYLIVLAGRLA